MMTMRRKIAFIAGMALCAAAAGAVLWPGLGAWFVADDFYHLSYIQGAEHPWRMFVLPSYSEKLFRPFSFTVLYYLSRAEGLAPWPLHLTDLILQSLDAALVFVLAYLIFRRAQPGAANGANQPAPESPLPPALAAGLVFAVHPVGELISTWFCCGADMLAMMFSLLTLILIAGGQRPSGPRLVLSGLTALLALLCKETHLPLAGAAFLLGLALGGPDLRARMKQAGTVALPVAAATAVYLVWRALVIHRLAMYRAPEGGLFAQAAYELPRVAGALFRDLFFYHLTSSDPLLVPLVVSLAGLALIGGAGALWRQRGPLLFGLGTIIVGAVPCWNLSQMAWVREERLFYFSVIGLAITMGSLVAGPRRWWLRGAALAAVVFNAAGLALISDQKIGDWRAGAEGNRKLAVAVANYITGLGPPGKVDRVYLLNAGWDNYNLDRMVKLELPDAYDRLEIMPADADSFIWVPTKLREQIDLPRLPPSALPARTPHQTDPDLVLETVSPPNLIDAASLDRACKILEWTGVRVHDLTPRCRQLWHQRLFFQSNARSNPYFLPSFPFRYSPLLFDWTMSPGLTRINPDRLGQPYIFRTSDNDPYLISPRLNMHPFWATNLEFTMTLPARAYTPVEQNQGCLSWEVLNRPGFPPENRACFKIIGDGQPHTYNLDLDANFAWGRSLSIARIRLDPISYPGSFEISDLEFKLK